MHGGQQDGLLVSTIYPVDRYMSYMRVKVAAVSACNFTAVCRKLLTVLAGTDSMEIESPTSERFAVRLTSGLL